MLETIILYGAPLVALAAGTAAGIAIVRKVRSRAASDGVRRPLRCDPEVQRVAWDREIGRKWNRGDVDGV